MLQLNLAPLAEVLGGVVGDNIEGIVEAEGGLGANCLYVCEGIWVKEYEYKIPQCVIRSICFYQRCSALRSSYLPHRCTGSSEHVR